MIELIGMLRTRTFRVLWALEEMGLAYEFHRTVPRADDVRAHNVSGKVPVLVEGDTVLTDSTAIMTYLADREGKLTAPAGTPERARQDAMTQSLLDELEGPLWVASKHSYILPEELRHPEIKDALRYEFTNGVGWLMQRMGDGPFVTGEEFTIADIIATHLGGWAGTAKFPIENEAFLAYLDRMRARPAFQKVNGLDG